MQSGSPSNIIATIIVSAAVAAGTGYFMTKSSCDGKASFSETQKQEIQKVLIDFLREKPDAFIGAVNEGVQAQQDKLRVEIEKSANVVKDKILTSSIVLGNPQADIGFAAFVDPMCPHCHEFIKLAFALVQKRQDISISVIPVAILGPNSVAMARVMLAASLQGADKFKAFMEKFVEKSGELDRAKLLGLAKEAGLDVAKLEKDETSEASSKTLEDNVKTFDSIKAAGVPTVFGGKKSGDLMMIPPMDVDNFSKLIDSFKEGKIGNSAGTMQPAAAGTVPAATAPAPAAPVVTPSSAASVATPAAPAAAQPAAASVPAGTGEVKKDGK